MAGEAGCCNRIELSIGAAGRVDMVGFAVVVPGGVMKVVVNVVLSSALAGTWLCSGRRLRGGPPGGVISTPGGEVLFVCDKSI